MAKALVRPCPLPTHPVSTPLLTSSVGFRGAALTGFVQCTAELTQGLVGCLPHVQVRALQHEEGQDVHAVCRANLSPLTRLTSPLAHSPPAA